MSSKRSASRILSKPNDGDISHDFDNIFSLCDISTLRLANPADEKRKKLASTFKKMTDLLGKLRISEIGVDALRQYQDQISQIASFAPQYDCKTGTKANGYRSIVIVSYRFITLLTEELVKFNGNGSHTMTPAEMNALDNLISCLEKLIVINEFLLELREMLVGVPEGSKEIIPPNIESLEPKLRTSAMKLGHLNYSVFYHNKTVGFHYNSTECRSIGRVILVSLASLADVFEGSFFARIQRATFGLFGIRYTLDQKLLAKKVLEEVKARQVNFCKTFFSLSEMDILHRNHFSIRNKEPEIKANFVFKIPPEKMRILNNQGAAFQVPIPSSHTDQAPIQARLISPFRTPDMIALCPCSANWFSRCSCQIVPASECIIFHLHGGGFVAQTSKSHQSYLKHWSKTLGVPILSIDYSLAPEAPYPRASEEVLYAYCWMRNNFKSLGTTGKRVIIVGDSAGGNLGSGLIQQCIQHSLPKPDYFVGIYPCFFCQMYPSPSRLVSLFDPIAAFPCLLRCLNSYADAKYNDTCPRTFTEELEACHFNNDPMLSPLLASVEIFNAFPSSLLVSSDVDPCLDETLAFANKLHDAQRKVDTLVFKGLPHGFLSLSPASKDCMTAVDNIAENLREIITSLLSQ